MAFRELDTQTMKAAVRLLELEVVAKLLNDYEQPYCNHQSPHKVLTGYKNWHYVCTRKRGHNGFHFAYKSDGNGNWIGSYCPPWESE